MALYQIGFIGAPEVTLRSNIETALAERLRELSLGIGTDVEIVSTATELLASSKTSRVAAYFGHVGAADSPDLTRLVESGIPALPIAPGRASFNDEIPPSLRHINGISVH